MDAERELRMVCENAILQLINTNDLIDTNYIKKIYEDWKKAHTKEKPKTKEKLEKILKESG